MGTVGSFDVVTGILQIVAWIFGLHVRAWSSFSSHLPGALQRFVNRDLRFLLGAARVLIDSRIASKQNLSAAEIFEGTVRANPNRTIFKYNGVDWTFQQVDNYANQVAHLFQSQGLKKGDCVALIATSCPQYLAIWIGLNKLGCVTALINFQLKGDALRHAIAVADCKMAIVGVDVSANYLSIVSALTDIQQSFLLCEGDSRKHTGPLPSFDNAVASMPTTKPVVADPPGYFDRLIYIYTSGTTGLPKPCIITTHRAYAMALLCYHLNRFKKDDVLLCTLPLYHSSGGMISVGQALFKGIPVVLKKKFSASTFWDDIRTDGCTIFTYVGELCRYLLAQPPSPKGRQHTLRVITGVGLRPTIWSEFVSRFNIQQVMECYASTEGNVGMANIDGHPGAIGFTSWTMEHLKQQRLIKIDKDTNEPVRNANGLCIPCAANEPGEMVGQITSSKLNSFEGYLDKKATAKKYLSNVFKNGDLFFRTGDIMVKDDEGYIYFVDRAGDTFRWKGENVSATEVEGMLSRLLSDVDVAVFGVTVPGCEGKAGMASISGSDAGVDLVKLSSDVTNALAAYARPLFLRFEHHIEMTGTFKIMKNALKEVGFDPAKCGEDHLYYWNKTQYERLTPEVYLRICDGEIRY